MTILLTLLGEKDFQSLLIIVLIVLTFGTVSYSFIEKWNFIDSLYFTVITLTTIGYGGISPKTDLGKMFTVAYIFIGLGLILAFINNTAKTALETHHNRIVAREKNIKQILENKK